MLSFLHMNLAMAGQEERHWRAEKRREKQRVAKQNRARVRRGLENGNYEAVLEDAAIPVRQRVAELHVGSNKARAHRFESVSDVRESP